MSGAEAEAEALFRIAELADERGDRRRAYEAYLRAAKLGHLLSKLAVGNSYASGSGVRRDFREAALWYRRAYRDGISAAAINMSVFLRKQGKPRAAINWLKRAMAMGDGEACLQLAQIYLRNRRQVKTAVSLLKKAIASWPSDISEESRDEAAAILRGLGKSV